MLSGSPTRPKLLVAIAMLALPSLAAAQRGPRTVTVGLGGGGSVPLGDFANDVKTGWHGAGFLQYGPERNVWAIRGEVQYHRADYTDNFLADVGATPGQKLTNGTTFIGGTAILLGARRDRSVTPYLLGGLGLYRVTASLKDESGLTASRSENGFGFNGGAGLRFGRTSGVFVEARFHQFSVTPKGEAKSTYQMIPISFGVTF